MRAQTLVILRRRRVVSPKSTHKSQHFPTAQSHVRVQSARCTAVSGVHRDFLHNSSTIGLQRVRDLELLDISGTRSSSLAS